jgi:hypothetical protein
MFASVNAIWMTLAIAIRHSPEVAHEVDGGLYVTQPFAGCQLSIQRMRERRHLLRRRSDACHPLRKSQPRRVKRPIADALQGSGQRSAGIGLPAVLNSSTRARYAAKGNVGSAF